MVTVGLYIAIPPGLEQRWSPLPPLSFGYLAAYARARAGGAEFIVERDLERLIAARPQIVGISYATPSARHAAAQARRVKEALGCPVLAGGPHVSALPGTLDPAFDAAVMGEGEETFAELLALHQAEGGFAPRALRKVRGILYRDADGCLTRTESRPLIQDLDLLPYPDRDLLGAQWRTPRGEAHLLTSRGCPGRCVHCGATAHWGGAWRMASEDYALGELELLRRKHGAELIHFADELFTADRARALGLMRGMRQRGLHEGAAFSASVRPGQLDEELMDNFARTHFKTLHIRFEPVGEAARRALNMPGSDAARRSEAVELARQRGIGCAAHFMLGAPGETRQEVLETFDFVRQNAAAFESVHFSPLRALPGTQAWDWARQRGYAETNAGGFGLAGEGFAQEGGDPAQRWPYFNERNIPREEMAGWLRMGAMLADMVGQLRAANERARSASYVAENVPIAEIMKQKARARLAKLLPPTGR